VALITFPAITCRIASSKEHAVRAVRDFERAYGAEYPKVLRRITDDGDELPAFFGFPAEHWIHLWTNNPIESRFVTVRLRTKVTRVPEAGPPHRP